MAALIVVLTRVLLSLWASFVLSTSPTIDFQTQYANHGIPLQNGGLAAPWQREDALWYEKIALRGYDRGDGTTVFLPLLPLLMRLSSLFTLGNVALAGMLTSSLAAVVALALLYSLATLDSDEKTGLRAVLFLALFPTAFFLQSAFTESVFLALAIGAFWQARHGRWWMVALLAGLSGLTKIQGTLLCVPLGYECFMWMRRHPGSPGYKAAPTAAVILAGPLATAAFFGFTRFVVGDPLSWSARQSAMWQHRLTWPGETLAVAVQTALTEGPFQINTFDLLILALFMLLTVGCFALRTSYGLQAITVLAPSLLHVGVQFPLMSFSRYALAAFPCFIVLGVHIGKRSRPVRVLVLLLSFSFLLLLSKQFVRGFWIG